MNDIVTTVMNTVNFISASGRNHRQFQLFLQETGSEHGDVLYSCELSQPLFCYFLVDSLLFICVAAVAIIWCLQVLCVYADKLL